MKTSIEIQFPDQDSKRGNALRPKREAQGIQMGKEKRNIVIASTSGTEEVREVIEHNHQEGGV